MLVQKRKTNLNAKPIVISSTLIYGFLQVTNIKPNTAHIGTKKPTVLNNFRTTVRDIFPLCIILSDIIPDKMVNSQKDK